ncbi:hypothetical protein ABID39_001137 [Bartonella japonica]|uniref:Uncharacterized protein n=1 Tax=Bartonella japonica TaxID=357761 RepID=A0ABV2FPE3_9HYPH
MEACIIHLCKSFLVLFQKEENRKHNLTEVPMKFIEDFRSHLHINFSHYLKINTL